MIHISVWVSTLFQTPHVTMYSILSGAGGGWFPLEKGSLYPQSGKALLQGAQGGESCIDAQDLFGWELSGGFGGGGGGCSSGGGGGGYTGGNVTQSTNQEHNGQGGSSYISPRGSNNVSEPSKYTVRENSTQTVHENSTQTVHEYSTQTVERDTCRKKQFSKTLKKC